jgi:hypothetical protein
VGSSGRGLTRNGRGPRKRSGSSFASIRSMATAGLRLQNAWRADLRVGPRTNGTPPSGPRCVARGMLVMSTAEETQGALSTMNRWDNQTTMTSGLAAKVSRFVVRNVWFLLGCCPVLTLCIHCVCMSVWVRICVLVGVRMASSA